MLVILVKCGGVADSQNLDPYILPVVEEKLKEFEDGEEYKKKAEDMKILTAIERKVSKEEVLSREDLIFLYEINFPIEGFGSEKDPRIEEALSKRDLKSDLTVLFDCSFNQIVINNAQEIDESTVVYLGEVEYESVLNWKSVPPYVFYKAKYDRRPLGRQIKIEFINPKEINFDKSEPDEEKIETVIFNPEMRGCEFDKAKLYTPDLSRLVGKPIREVAEYVVRTYGDEYRIPGSEYWNWFGKNRSSIEGIDKDKIYYLFGSVGTIHGLRTVAVVGGSREIYDGSFVEEIISLESAWNERNRAILIKK